uniref:Uncharacterized protein n=1 Tax=Panagrolaimus sp. ES5 TaxID=591445 RepID=A0AC34G3Y9_9BILA
MAEPEEKEEMGFVELVKSYLNQMVEPDEYYDDISFNERRKKLLEAEGLPLSPDSEDLPITIPKSKYVENPSPDAEVPSFDKKQLPPQLLQYKYGDAIPFDDAQKEF